MANILLFLRANTGICFGLMIFLLFLRAYASGVLLRIQIFDKAGFGEGLLGDGHSVLG